MSYLPRPTWQAIQLANELHRRADLLDRAAARSGNPGRVDRLMRLADLYRDTASDVRHDPSPPAARDAHALLSITFGRTSR